MKIYHGGEQVGAGEYWSFSNGHLVSAKKEMTLPGNNSYIRVPIALLLLAGPFLGLAFVMFLPFIGFAFLGYHLAKATARLSVNAAHSLVDIATQQHVPGFAYFLKKKHNKKYEREPKATTPLDSVEKEVNARKVK